MDFWIWVAVIAGAVVALSLLEALNAMNPGASERRVSLEFFEVPVQAIS